MVLTVSDSNNNNNNLQQIQESHPLAYHSSRILDDDIARYKSLQQYLVLEVIPETNVEESKLN